MRRVFISPIGSFLFVGPTGVGKTETAKSLAQQLFDDENAMIRIDMSEYMEKHAVSRLIGAPPGYVGYEEGGQLTEAVRRRPYSVVLFDEIEKAHPEVFNVLLQLLDDGRLTDGQGRTVDFRNTVVIMTSNIGSQYVEKMESIGFSNNSSKEDYSNMKDKVMESLKDNFRPEFLNRIDEVVLFDVLGQTAIREIVNLRTKVVGDRLLGKGISLVITNEALDVLSRTGYDPHFGARPLNRLIQTKILNPVASAIIGNGVTKGDTVKVDAKDGEIVVEIKKLSKKVKSPLSTKVKKITKL